MITASHNPEGDNGVKIVEPMGEMLPIPWEGFATSLANASDTDLETTITQLVEDLKIDTTIEAHVIIGRDTRASSPALAMAAADGVTAINPEGVFSLGIVSTPQLHYIVRCTNDMGAYGCPTTSGYAEKLTTAFENLVSCKPLSECSKYTPELVVDCANGVGALAFQQILDQWASHKDAVKLVNDGAGDLNKNCGADFVKISQAPPCGVDLKEGMRMTSLDGDADRVVYFCHDGEVFRLLDGDRIALLLAHVIGHWLEEAGIDDLQKGLVQTAYANGASTVRAAASLGAENVICAKTGVKHVHHKATQMDAGIYFEANGHGTVLFSDKFVARVTSVLDPEGPNDLPTQLAAKRLLCLRAVINETVGDGISNVLVVEAILRLLDWSCSEWLAMYSDLPSRQVKVKVADREAIMTTNEERTCTKPEGLQNEIDRLVEQTPCGRAFVRPSGTEDVVRVYVEAESLSETLKLAQAVVDAVYDQAGGVGPKPTVS